MNINTEINALESLWEQRHKSVKTFEQRCNMVVELLEAYFEEYGVYPDSERYGGQLERLNDFVLAEDLSDKSKGKRKKVTYNFHSNTQKEYDQKHEASFSSVEHTHNCRGRNFAKPLRKYAVVTDFLQAMEDESHTNRLDAQESRNEERARKYREFIRRQPVHRYNIKELDPDQ